MRFIVYCTLGYCRQNANIPGVFYNNNEVDVVIE